MATGGGNWALTTKSTTAKGTHTTVVAEQKHRSHWTARVTESGFNPHRFLPTAPKPVPRKVREEKKDEPPPPQEEEKEMLTSPPPEALEEGNLNILDRYNNYRGYIAYDGTCYNNRQEIIGFISCGESGEGQAGDPEERYLGCIQFHMSTNKMTVLDDLDEKVGYLDLGTARIHDEDNRMVGKLTKAGELSGCLSYLGQFEGFDFHALSTVALYLLLIDTGMLNKEEEG
mmetsp:Transcript_15594/g.44235  ORF Transcript_15594/g.44235 Transcript_15594/m.44235 type:complete len:229 (+) Transcript_15594:230-916(+)|eukprot:CAMPEP_0119119148 /NCGR_PEP_ID=MMETSP1310-20130426/764_1 /TAXON_ID=464262 /ORGANISM="Genus nov. species nov., Strain RCC2339" /LENGTH=228 /DNA_ID=CAMNT_0007108565 /DNA_START=63 /DNA_END=749 /DNA_ORIENTATION=-